MEHELNNVYKELAEAKLQAHLMEIRWKNSNKIACSVMEDLGTVNYELNGLKHHIKGLEHDYLF